MKMNHVGKFLDKLGKEHSFNGGYFKCKCPEGKEILSIDPEGNWDCRGSQMKYCDNLCPKSGNLRELFKPLFFEYHFRKLNKNE